MSLHEPEHSATGDCSPDYTARQWVKGHVEGPIGQSEHQIPKSKCSLGVSHDFAHLFVPPTFVFLKWCILSEVLGDDLAGNSAANHGDGDAGAI